MSRIDPSTYDFLRRLKRNNNRDWFAAHREEYDKARTNAEDFFASLIQLMNTHDDIETPSGKKAMYRIHNDVRFSADKTPYKVRFAGYLRRRKPQLRGGYYLWITPGATRVGCGFAYPNPEDLRRIRTDIDNNNPEWRRLLRSPTLRKHLGEMQGSQVKTAPQGFPREHPAIDLLRYKQFWFEHGFTDREVMDSQFIKNIDRAFRSIRPFFDYMSEVLTTDENGVSIL